VFKHALLEDALTRCLVKGKRQEFHDRLQKSWKRSFRKLSRAVPELLAASLYGSEPDRQGGRYWLSAGRKSRDRFANIEAISHLCKGLDLLPRWRVRRSATPVSSNS